LDLSNMQAALLAEDQHVETEVFGNDIRN